MATTKDYQEITLTAANTSGNLIGAPGPVEISGTFNGATVTQALIDGTVAVDTYLVAATFFANATRETYSISGGGGSENVTVRKYTWYQPY